MGENVDVKALAAKLRQAGMMAQGGGVPQRLPPPVFERGHHSPVDSGPNGGVRPRLNKPNTGPVSPANGPRSSPGPHGVFPRPPPSHRPNHQEPVRPPIAEADKPGPFRKPGDKLVRPMPKPQGSPGFTRAPQAIQTPPMRPQRSLTGEVEPLLRPLPPVGPRPNKPKRPPFVNLEPFRRNTGTPKPIARLSGRISEDSNSPTTPRAAGARLPLPPNKPKPLTASVSKHDSDDDQDTYDDIDALPSPPSTPPAQTQESFSPFKTAGISAPPLKPAKPSSLIKSVSVQDLDDDQDTYDDIEPLPPPPPAPPSQTQDSWSDQHSSQADEWDDSDGSEIYEEVDSQDSIPVPPDRFKQSKKDIKRQKELEKKEQKERQKKESENRKKFKLNGNETPLHIARVREDWHGGKNDLRVHQGDSVEIIRIDNNPEGRWLARTMDGNYGYISTKCVDMDYEEVKRRFGSFAKPRPDPGLYDDIDKFVEGYGCDDDEFPPPPLEVSPDPKTLKRMEKEEKEFRKRFKFEGPIQVLQYRTVDPNGNIKRASGKDLNVCRGENLEVIELTNEKKLLCRNAQGKYGYVPTAYLLAEEGEIYDDIDHTDVYDNDNNM